MGYRPISEYATMPRMQYTPSRMYTIRPKDYGQCDLNNHPGYNGAC